MFSVHSVRQCVQCDTVCIQCDSVHSARQCVQCEAVCSV